MKTNKVISQILSKAKGLTFEDIYNSLLREFYFASGKYQNFLMKHSNVSLDSLYHADFQVTSWTQDSGNLNINVRISIPDVFIIKPKVEGVNSYILSADLALYNFRTDGAHFNDDIIDCVYENIGPNRRKVYYYNGKEEKRVPTTDYLVTVEEAFFTPEVDAYLYSRIVTAEYRLTQIDSFLASLSTNVDKINATLLEHVNKSNDVVPSFKSMLDKSRFVDSEQYEPLKRLKVADVLPEVKNDNQVVSVQLDSDGNLSNIETLNSESLTQGVSSEKSEGGGTLQGSDKPNEVGKSKTILGRIFK